MFAKLLKHEWRATRGIIGLLCVIILICGLMIGCSVHYLIWAENSSGGPQVVVEVGSETSGVMSVICVLLVITGVMAVAVCGAASVFVVVWRFYKSRFTDEGYLTFTLPVTHHQLLLSSILNSIWGVFLVILACIAAIGIAAVLFLLAIQQEIIWADVWVSLESVWQQLWESFCKNADQFVLLGISTVVSVIAQLIELMLAVTIGALIAKKHKLLAAVGVYFGISMVQSFTYSVLAVTASTTQDVNILLSSPGILGIAVTVIGYFLMYWMTSRKLNLN